MKSPISLPDALVLTLVIIGLVFIRVGLNSDNNIFILLGVIEMILAIVQNMINKNQFMFE